MFTAHADAARPLCVRPRSASRLPDWLPLSAIEDAAERLSGQLVRTPLLRAATLGRHLWLKAETFQATGAFKERGALNRLLRLTAPERRAGVVAMSAGNHAQGVALHARRLGVRATIVMPQTAPAARWSGRRRWAPRWCWPARPSARRRRRRWSWRRRATSPSSIPMTTPT
nr:pyridoxal-phosphate dependent enzyme [Azospirillum thermophilum]